MKANAVLRIGDICSCFLNSHDPALEQYKAYLKRFPNGERKEMEEFMIETCSRSSLAIKEKNNPIQQQGMKLSRF
ncbi:MAG TPA: hypothetical protein DDY17_03805 [Syntrophaceae bacterium]|jgi:hypothetical protein|nr:hypothetical protein [Syntrophaceae bacterium]